MKSAERNIFAELLEGFEALIAARQNDVLTKSHVNTRSNPLSGHSSPDSGTKDQDSSP